jgi:hypothetical protein
LFAHLNGLHLSEMYEGNGTAHFDFFLPYRDWRIFESMEREVQLDISERECLYSWRMTSYYDRCDQYNESSMDALCTGLLELDDDRFGRWLKAGTTTDFDHQLFRRAEIARWLAVFGCDSKYCFQAASDAHPTSQIVRFAALTRRDILSPVIEHAASLCRNGSDVAELWVKLRTLAREKTAPLIGVTDMGIQYLDVNDMPKEFTVKALRARLRRAR